MTSVKKPQVPAVNVDQLYSRYLKESIIHRREIVQYEVEGNKYLLTYAQKKGEWYYSDCILIVTLNLQGRLIFGFSRMTTGFPIHQKVLPVFKRSIPIEQIKDVKINKEKELHILIQGFGDQSLWKFKFFSSGMVQKWSDLLIKLRFHNAQKQASSLFFSSKAVSKIEEVKVPTGILKGQVAVQRPEVKLNKQPTKQAVLAQGHQHLQVKKQQVKVQANKLHEALPLPSESLYKSKIAELQRERDQLKTQLKRTEKIIQPNSKPVNALEDQNLLKSKISELQKQKNDMLLESQTKSKQKDQIALELQQRSKLDKQTISQLSKTKAELLIEIQNKNKEKQQVLSEVVLNNQTLKSKLAESAKTILQSQTKYANLKKDSQAALVVLNHEKELLGQKNIEVLKLKEELKSQLQITQKMHEKNFFQLSQENKICKEKIVETQKAKEAIASQLTSKIAEHEQIVIDFNQKQKGSEEKITQLQKIKASLLLDLEKLTQQNNQCKERIVHLQSQSSKLEHQFKDYTALSQKRQLQHQELKENYQDLLRAKVELETQLTEKIRTNQSIIDQLNDQNKDIKAKITEREQAMLNLKAQNQLNHKNFQGKLNLINSELNQNKIKVEQLLRAKTQLQSKSQQHQKAIADLTAQNGVFKQQNISLSNQIVKIKEQHEKKLKQKDSIVLQLNTKIASFKQTIQQLEFNRADMLLTIQNKQKSLVMMDSALSQLKAQKNKIQQQRKQQQKVNKELIIKKQLQTEKIKAKLEELSSKILAKDQQLLNKKKTIEQISNDFKAKGEEWQKKHQDLEGKLNSANKSLQNLSQSIKIQQEKSILAAQAIRNKDFQNQKLRFQLESIQNKLKMSQTQLEFIQAQLQHSKANSLSQLIRINTQGNEDHKTEKPIIYSQPEAPENRQPEVPENIIAS